VEGDAMGAFVVTVDRTRFAPLEPIGVSVKGVPKYMQDDGAVVGIYREDAAPEDFVVYVQIFEREKRINFDAPGEAGKYEIRGYANAIDRSESTMTVKIPFEVAE